MSNRLHFLLETALRLRLLLLCLAAGLGTVAAQAQPGDDIVVQARDALRSKDKARLAGARVAVTAAGHPLAMWVEYWELSNRLAEAQQADLDAFYERWRGSYVEDRLRNDWLLELGKRRDWANFRADFPRFRMNDDREVTCYALLTRHLDGQDVRDAALEAWFSQRDLDDGCQAMATALVEAKVFKPADAWHKARLAIEINRPRAARAAAALVRPANDAIVGSIVDDPVRWLRRQPHASAGPAYELELLALMRLAASDPEQAAGLLAGAWSERLPGTLTATAWAHAARQAALKQQPQAAAHARRAWQLWDAAARPKGTPPPWSDDLLAWHVRAALRQPGDEASRWPLMSRAIAAMSVAEQRDSAWVYWRARATLAGARPGADGDGERALATLRLQAIATQLSFYGKLATEELGASLALPPAPLPLSSAERDAARAQPGLARALKLIELGLRNEGVREWNYSLRGLADRELLAAAQWACEREVWDRCINTSDRTRGEVDLAQRFPLPFRQQVLAQARETGIDPAVIYGLIRQESRFITDVRSSVGASGLMQLMPATARWTARKIGQPYTAAMINDSAVNLRLGSAYFKLVLDDFGGSLAMATAAYNAGPNRPRRWREGALMEPAAWAETIPFNETRDYVKKVLSNSVYYAALLGMPGPTLKARLGAPIGPRDTAAPAGDRDLP
ncbi:MAG: transglycosylase SLT domain-containing protein [Rubrivivax sp.]|nr:transglycosylase SLT domain-containing protein [Rubrivivax sp.]